MVKISNKKFQIIDSVNPKFTEVIVTFKADEQIKRHYIFLRKENGKSNASYLKDAEKQFELDLKSKKVTSLKGKGAVPHKGSSGLMKGLVIALSATTLACGGLCVYQYLTRNNSNVKEISGESAIEFLKDADKEKAKQEMKVTKGSFTWDINATGEGMLPDKDAGTVGAIQLLLAYYIDSSQMTNPTFLENFKNLEGNYDRVGEWEIGSSNILCFVDSDDIEEMISGEFGEGGYTKFTVENDLLHISFVRTQTVMGTVNLFVCQNIYARKDGFVDHYDVSFSNQAIKLSTPITCDGIFSGPVKTVPTLEKK